MSWTIIKTVELGPTYAGLSDLRAQLYNSAGATAGAAISAGFTADLIAGKGVYGFTYASMADGFRGYIRFYSLASAIDSAVQISIDGTEELPFVVAKILTQALLIGADNANFPANSVTSFDAVTLETSTYWSQTFNRATFDITGWTQIVFTVKVNPETESDDDALICLRITNPAEAGTDGINVHNRAAVDTANALRTSGGITVNTVSPDTSITVTLLPLALVLTPIPSNDPYTFGIDVYDASNGKRSMGSGEFWLKRAVRRGVGAP